MLVLGLLLAPSLGWLARDETVWDWDPAWYGEVSVDLWWKLMHARDTWWHAMEAAFGIKAPGVAWLGQFFVPLGVGLKSVDRGLLCMQMLAGAITLPLWFGIGKRLWQGDSRGGWLLALLGAGAPLFVGLAHQYFVEPLQLLGVTWVYWLALASGEMSRLRLGALTVLSAAFVLAIKVTSPLSCLLPGLLIVIRLFRPGLSWCSNGSKGRWFDAFVLLVSGAVTLLTARWYWLHQQELRDFVQFATTSDAARVFGGPPSLVPKLNFWLPAAYREFFQPLAGVGIFLLIVMALVTRSRRPKNAASPAWNRAIVGAAAGEIVLVLYSFTRQYPEVSRYLMPLLPSVLIVVMALLGLGPRRFITLAGLSLAFAQWGWSHGVTLGVLPAGGRQSPWLVPVNPDVTHRRELDRLIAVTTTLPVAHHYNMNGYETAWLNANSLAFHAAKYRLQVGFRCYYTSLGFMANDFGAAWQRFLDMKAESFISVAAEYQPQPPDINNRIALTALEKIKADRDYHIVPFESAYHIVLYVRSPASK